MTTYEQQQDTEQQHDALITTSFTQPVGFPSPDGLSFKERKQLAFALGRFQQPSQPLENYFGRKISIIGFIQHPAQVTDMQTGEIRDVTRTVFCLADNGGCLSSTSEAVSRFCSMLLGIFGAPDMGFYPEPLTVSVMPQKTRGGKNTYALSIVEEE